MSKIDERLEAMGIDTSGMSDEEKFQAATGFTFYDEDMAENDWYVPGGAANMPSEDNGGKEQMPSAEEISEHIGEEVTDENKKYDVNNDGVIDEKDVQQASEIEVITEADAEWEYIYDETTWNAAYANPTLQAYYEWSDEANKPYKEDLWNTVENRAANGDDMDGTDENGQGNYPDCVRCWDGAVNAPGAKYPWAVITLPKPFEGTVKFVYDGGDPVYPFGSEMKTFNKGFGIVSIPTELGDEFLLDANGETTFDKTKLEIKLVQA